MGAGEAPQAWTGGRNGPPLLSQAAGAGASSRERTGTAPRSSRPWPGEPAARTGSAASATPAGRCSASSRCCAVPSGTPGARGQLRAPWLDSRRAGARASVFLSLRMQTGCWWRCPGGGRRVGEAGGLGEGGSCPEFPGPPSASASSREEAPGWSLQLSFLGVSQGGCRGTYWKERGRSCHQPRHPGRERRTRPSGRATFTANVAPSRPRTGS